MYILNLYIDFSVRQFYIKPPPVPLSAEGIGLSAQAGRYQLKQAISSFPNKNIKTSEG